MKIIDLEQGTPAWLKWRSGGLGSSDAPVVLRTSPWETPRGLWEMKTGKKPPPKTNSAMQRGCDLEPMARKHYEQLTGISAQPACGEHDELSYLRVSLDGYNPSNDLIIEFKAPWWGDHESAKKGKVPEKYIPQVQYQLLVSGLVMAHYVSYSPQQDSMALVEIKRDEKMIKELVERCTEFWKKVTDNKWE